MLLTLYEDVLKFLGFSLRRTFLLAATGDIINYNPSTKPLSYFYLMFMLQRCQ